MENQPDQHAAVTLTDANFAAEVKSFEGLVLVDFWADWCTPCKVMAPAVEAIAQKYAANPAIKVGKLDVDANQETSMEYRVMSLPTFKLFHNGKVIDEIIGSVGGPALEKFLERSIPQATPAPAATA